MIGNTIGNIRIVERLGKGGMGEVYVGYDEKLDRKVAVKIIGWRHRLQPEARQRFIREARLLSRLEHPNICRIYEFIEGEDHDTLVLELISGRPLTQAGLEASVKGRLRIAEDIAQALTFAHSRQVVHRDLKPDNIMITDDGRVKILDFGLARLADEASGEADAESGLRETPQVTLAPSDPTMVSGPSGIEVDGKFHTVLGTIIGTPMFMSPEQARGEPVTTASDMYSFGLLLQWLMTGETPFPKDSAKTNLIFLAMNGETEAVRGVDAGMTALINALKSVDPTGRPIAPDVLTRIRYIRNKPLRRMKRAVLAAFIAVLLSGTVLATVGFVRARREAENARQTLELIQEFLSSVDPREKGKDLKVLDLLRTFMPRLEQLDDRPNIQASLLLTYANTYNGLGLYEESHQCAERAYRLRKDLFGEAHPATLDALRSLASACLSLGRYDEAETLSTQCLELRRRALGENHRDTIISQSDLANVFHEKGQFQDAERHYAQCLEKLEENPEQDPVVLLGVTHNLGSVLLSQGKFAEAEKRFRACLERREEVLGPEHPDTLATSHNLAVCLYNQGKFAEAEDLFRRSMEARVRLLGADHPTTIGALLNLGNCLWSQGKVAQAERMFREGLERSKLGEEHPSTLRLRNNLAIALHVQGKIEEALEAYRHGLDVGMRVLGPDHPLTIGNLNNIGNALSDLGRIEEAEPYYRRCLAVQERVLGPDHNDTLGTRFNLAELERTRGNLAQAEVEFRRLLEDRTRVLGAEHPDTLTSLKALGGVLVEQNRFAEAEPLYRQCLTMRREVLGADHPDTLLVANELADCLVNQGRHLEEAETLMRETLERELQTVGENSNLTAATLDILADVLDLLGRPEEAQTTRNRAQEILRSRNVEPSAPTDAP